MPESKFAMPESQKPLTFAIFGNTYQKEKAAHITTVLHSILNIGGRITIEETFAHFLHQVADLSGVPHSIASSASIHADFAISIGGDGTFLNTARMVGHRLMPLIGINTGRLGFISDLMPQDTDQFFLCLKQGQFQIEERSLLQVSSDGNQLGSESDKAGSDGNQLGSSLVALNEIAVLKHDNSSMINIQAEVDDAYLATYMADGLIVSTPTGSTGYSLSVGGPIISPNSQSIVLSPIAAHSLSVRPIVLNNDVRITLRIHSRSCNFMIAIDGRSRSLPNETVLHIQTAPYRLRIVRPLHHSFFDTLRNKLLWGADKR